MWLLALELGIFQIVGFVGFAWLLRMYFDRKQRDIEARIDATIRDWVEPQADGAGSKFAQAVDRVGGALGAAIARSIKASLNAELSHASRMVNTLNGEAGGGDPAASLLGMLGGGRHKGKGAALQQVAGLVAGLIGGHGNHEEGGGRSALQKRIERGG